MTEVCPLLQCGQSWISVKLIIIQLIVSTQHLWMESPDMSQRLPIKRCICQASNTGSQTNIWWTHIPGKPKVTRCMYLAGFNSLCFTHCNKKCPGMNQYLSRWFSMPFAKESFRAWRLTFIHLYRSIQEYNPL